MFLVNWLWVPSSRVKFLAQVFLMSVSSLQRCVLTSFCQEPMLRIHQFFNSVRPRDLVVIVKWIV